MNTLRIICVVALCFVAIASAAGNYATCPALSGTAAYTNTTCAGAGTCFSALCTCLGGSVTSGVCTGYSTTLTCSAAYTCVQTFVVCMNAAPATSAACKSSLAALTSSLVMVTSGLQNWNASDAYSACKSYGCTIYNTTVGPSCTSTNGYGAVCDGIVPVTFSGQFTMGGNWSGIVGNSANLAAAITCLSSDLTNQLGYPTTVTSITLNADSTALIVFVSNVHRSMVETKLATMSGTTSWLQCFTAAKFTSLGGTGTVSVGTVMDSPTPNPAGTTPTPSRAPTPAPTPTKSAGFMWSVSKIIVAVAMIVVLV